MMREKLEKFTLEKMEVHVDKLYGKKMSNHFALTFFA